MFSGSAADLELEFLYELEALEYMRGALFGQSESAFNNIEITLGNYSEHGGLYTLHTRTINVDSCENAVRYALSRLQPLAFIAAFKIQDIICEWILRENLPDGKVPRTFSEKISKYDQRRDEIMEPRLFSENPSIKNAFWEIYRKITKYRNSLIHSGGVEINILGDMTIRSAQHLLTLSSRQQAAYIAAICIIAKLLIGRANNNSYLHAILESYLHFLIDFHSIGDIKQRRLTLVRLKVIVPPEKLISENPISVNIDWAELRETTKNLFDRDNTGVEIMISAIVEVSLKDSVSTWDIPIEAVPTHTSILAEGDQRFDSFLLKRVP